MHFPRWGTGFTDKKRHIRQNLLLVAANHLLYFATLTEANSLNITFTLQYAQYLHWAINSSFVINDAAECVQEVLHLLKFKTINLASYLSIQLRAGN